MKQAPPPMHRLKAIGLSILVGSSSYLLQAQTVTTNNVKAITLEESIQMALAHNFDIQIQRQNPDIARFTLGAAYGAYDPVAFAQGRHEYSASPGGIDAQARPYQGAETEADTFSAGIRGILPTGLSYAIQGNVTDSYGSRPSFIEDRQTIIGTNTVTLFDANNNPITLNTFEYATIPIRAPFENSSGQVGVLEMRQPLLQGFWIDPTRANIQISRNRLKYTEQAFRLQMMAVISAVEQAYNNLIFARENVKVQAKSLELAERLLMENQKKVQVGTLAPLDEKEAQSQVAARRADLLNAEAALEVQENVLKSLITDEYAKWHPIRLVPTENLIAIPQSYNLQESWDKGLRMRPEVAQARLDVQRGEINVRLDRNQLFPQLDLIGQFGYGGSGAEFSDAFGSIKRQENPFYFYGASISYPLGNRVARNNLKISKALKDQADLFLKQVEQSVLIEIDDAIKLSQSGYDRIEATRQARLFAEAALEAEQKRLESGKGTSFVVLQLQRDLTAARFEEIRALAEYNNTISRLYLREGTTLEKHNIDLQFK